MTFVIMSTYIRGHKKGDAKMLDLYVNIRNRRKELGMSQEELARKVGYTSRSTIARIENGEIDLSRSKILAFADALNTTPSELMGWSEETEDALNKEYHSEATYFIDSDWIVKLLDDPDLKVIIDKATTDAHYKNRLIQIAKLLENDK